MKTGTKIILTLLALGGAGAVAYAVYDGATNLHFYRTVEEWHNMESEVGVGDNLVMVGFAGDNPQADEVRTMLAEMAGRFPDVQFVGLEHDLAVGTIPDIQNGWGGVGAGVAGETVSKFVSIWGPQTTRDQLRADLLAAVATVSDVQEAGLSVAEPESESIPIA